MKLYLIRKQQVFYLHIFIYLFIYLYIYLFIYQDKKEDQCIYNKNPNINTDVVFNKENIYNCFYGISQRDSVKYLTKLTNHVSYNTKEDV
jgi:hypothetical protein